MVTDITVKSWAPTWIRNLVGLDKNNGVEKLSFKGITEKTNYIVAGAGSSLDKAIEQLQGIEGFIVANQSSLLRLLHAGIKPEIMLVVDANPSIPDIIRTARKHGWKGKVVAATHCPKEIDFDITKPVYWFKHPLLQDNEAAKMFNEVVMATSPKIDTTIVQAGSVSNTSILLLKELMRQKIIPQREIVLTGVDYSFQKDHKGCLKPNENWELVNDVASVEDQAKRYLVGGFLTDDMMMAYRGDLKFMLTHGIDGVYLLHQGFLSDFIV